MDDTVLLPVTASDDVTTPEIKYECTLKEWCNLIYTLSGNYSLPSPDLDHTADVQIHSWGANVVEAFEQCAVGMFGYITDLKTVTPSLYTDVEVSGGDDLTETLYRFLDDLLFLFCAEPFMIPKVSSNAQKL